MSRSEQSAAKLERKRKFTEPGKSPAALKRRRRVERLVAESAAKKIEASTITQTTEADEQLKALRESRRALKKQRRLENKHTSSESTANALIPNPQPELLTATKIETIKEKQAWTLGSISGGRLISRDPIYLDEVVVTAVGNVIKVFDTTTSLTVATLLPYPGTSIITFDAVDGDVQTVRVYYDNGSFIDWNWVTQTREESKSQLQHIDLNRLLETDEGVVDVITTWTGKSSSIFVDGVKSHKTPQRIFGLKLLANGDTIVALCDRAIIVGRKEDLDKYKWVELPWIRRLTCFDVREVQNSKQKEINLVVGQDDGVLQLFNNLSESLTSNDLPPPRLLHWHRNAVGSVKFSQDGRYLVSGGQETVLVIWQLETGQKSYLPNLTSTIEHIVVSPSGDRYALQLGDNSIMVLSTTELKPVANFAGLQCSSEQSLVARLHPQKPHHLLLAVPSDQQAISRPFLQTYDLTTDQHISRQALTRNNITDLNTGPDRVAITPPDVERLSISADGQWLATVDVWTPPHRDLMHLATEEYMTDEHKYSRQEVYLKFWQWNDNTQDWMLNSRIDQPHSKDLGPGSIHKLVSDTIAPAFYTLGEDSIIRIWRPQRKMRHGVALMLDGKEEMEWVCKHEIDLERLEDRTDLDYEGVTPLDAALTVSEDGSLLAAAMLHDGSQVVHFIDTMTGEVKSSHANIAATDLVELAFADRFLIALSRKTLRVWNVVENRLHWNVNVPYSTSALLAISRTENVVAVAFPNDQTTTIMLCGLVPASVQHRFETDRPVAALLAHPNTRGFKLIFEDASIQSLTSSLTLSNAQQIALTQEVVEPVQAAVQQKRLQIAEAAIVASEPNLEDDRQVVRPEQLANIFEVGPNGTALPSVREMLHAVTGLFGRKAQLV